MRLAVLAIASLLAIPAAAQSPEDKEVTLKLSEFQSIINAEIARARAEGAYASIRKQVQPPASNLEPPSPPKIEQHPLPEPPQLPEKK